MDIKQMKEITSQIDKNEYNELPYVDDGLMVDYKSQLNERQLMAVVNTKGPMLVIAGAGSGKTRTLSYRVSYMIEKKIDPRNVLLLTFTRKAAKEMIDRTQTILSKNLGDMIEGGTFHSFANKMLRKYALLLGIENNFTILDNIDSEDVIDLVKRDMDFPKRKRAFPKKSQIFKVISMARNFSKSINDIIENEFPLLDEFSDDIENIALEYDRYKKNNNQLDYDDLLLEFLKYLKNNKVFLNMIQRQYKYIMVDEYQDTNIAQRDIVDIIASKEKNVMVVGDDSQSIYAFRGANYENILTFPLNYPDCKIIKLEKNYRSTQNILDFTNEIIENLEVGYKKKLYSDFDFPIMPSVKRFESQEAEAEYIADEIEKLSQIDVDYSNIAILFGSTFHSNMIQFELVKRGIPFVFFGGIKFAERRHVKDVIAYLKLFLNLKDGASFNRVAKLINGVGSKTIKNLHECVSDNVIDFKKYRNKKYYGDLKRLENLVSVNMDETVCVKQKVINVKDFYLPILKTLETDYDLRMNDVDVLIALAGSYRSLESFLSDLSLEPPSDRYQDSISPVLDDTENGKVVLSTVHSAKGLEWENVFLIHMLDGLFPSAREVASLEKLDESRRLFYVACTRAKSRLELTMPATVASYNAFFTYPSRFIEEINDAKFVFEM